MIPLTESGIRTYEEVQDLLIKDTIVERTRGCYALYGVGKVHLENATAREASISLVVRCLQETNTR